MERDEFQDYSLRPDLGGGVGADGLWCELAAAAQHPLEMPDGKALAEWVHGRGPAAEATAWPIARTLYGSVRTLETAPADAMARLSEFLGHLDLPILTAALRTAHRIPDRPARHRVCANRLSVRALLRLFQASWNAADRQPTPPLKQLVPKLARESVRVRADSEDGGRTRAEGLFRDVVAGALDVLPLGSGAAPASPASLAPPRRGSGGRAEVGAERVVQTALETGAIGRTVSAAVEESIDAGRTTQLLDLLRSAPEQNAAAALIRTRVATLAALARLLAEDPVDFETVDVVVAGLGIAAAKALIEATAESTSRVTRRGAFERLVRLGPDIAPLIEPRLLDSRWFVVRNMIALLREARAAADVASVGRFTTHPDARVRREALLLLLGHAETRDHAICEALKDADRHVLRVGLQAARGGLPDAAVPTLTRRLTSGEFPPEFRVLALHLLGRTPSTLALDALLHFVQAGHSLVGRPKLAPKSAEMLAALSSLARRWPRERRAAPLLAAAAKSRDAQVREASRGLAEVGPSQ